MDVREMRDLCQQLIDKNAANNAKPIYVQTIENVVDGTYDIGYTGFPGQETDPYIVIKIRNKIQP